MPAQLSPQQILSGEPAGEKIQSALTEAPGNGAPLGGGEGYCREQMVRGASVRNRRDLQDPC